MAANVGSRIFGRNVPCMAYISLNDWWYFPESSSAWDGILDSIPWSLHFSSGGGEWKGQYSRSDRALCGVTSDAMGNCCSHC